MANDNFRVDRSIFAPFANYQNRVPHFLTAVAPNSLRDSDRYGVGSHMQFAVRRSDTAHFVLAVVHREAPLFLLLLK